MASPKVTAYRVFRTNVVYERMRRIPGKKNSINKLNYFIHAFPVSIGFLDRFFLKDRSISDRCRKSKDEINQYRKSNTFNCRAVARQLIVTHCRPRLYIYIYIYIYKRATTPQVQSQFCPNESHYRLGTRSPIVRSDWGRVARWP